MEATTYPIIKNPEYVDLEKTTIRMTLISESGLESVAEFKVPANKERGVNQYWDRIMDEFDVEAMRQARNDLERRRMRQAEMDDKRKKANEQNERLRQLFDMKIKLFNFPFIANATMEEKAAVRRAPDMTLLMVVVTTLAQKYMQDNSLTFIDFFDQIEDILYNTTPPAE